MIIRTIRKTIFVFIFLLLSMNVSYSYAAKGNIQEYQITDKFIYENLIHDFLVECEHVYNIHKKVFMDKYINTDKEELIKKHDEYLFLSFAINDSCNIDSYINFIFLETLLLEEIIKGEDSCISLEKECAKMYAYDVMYNLAQDAMNNHEQAVLCTQAYS